MTESGNVIFNHSCYIEALIYFLKTEFEKLKIYRFAKLPKNVGGRVSYKQNWIKIDCCNAKEALMTLAHEGGHYISYIRYKGHNIEKDYNKEYRERFAYLYGWRLLTLIGAKRLINKNDCKIFHDIK